MYVWNRVAEKNNDLIADAIGLTIIYLLHLDEKASRTEETSQAPQCAPPLESRQNGWCVGPKAQPRTP